MSLRDDDLRAAYKATAAPLGAHPDSEALVRAAEGALLPDEREAVVSHLETCAPCAADVRMAFEALGAPSLPESRGIPRGWLAVAAVAAILAAGAGVLLNRGTMRPAISGERGAPAPVHRSKPDDGATLTVPPYEIAWEDAPAAEEYTLLLYDAESRLLWRSPPSKNPRATLPPDVRGRLAGGSRYLWRVRYASGFDSRESPVFSFTLTRR